MSLSEIKFEHANSAIRRELVSLQVDVAREPVRVLGHDLHAIRAVGLVDPHRTYRADPVAVQEDHDLARDLLLGPGCRNPLGAGPYPIH